MPNTTDESTNSSFEETSVGKLAVLVALNSFSAITASVGNALILIALYKVTSIHPPTKLFFRCLAVTDLCVGIISQPLFTVMLIYEINPSINLINRELFVSQRSSSLILGGVSLLTSTAISVDRLLALLLGLRYRFVVTLRRVRALIIFFWFLVCALVGVMYILDDFDFSLLAYLILMLISFIISTISFANIYFRLRQQMLLVQGNHQQEQQQPPSGVVATALNLARYEKTVSAIIWIQLGLFACYCPWCVISMLDYFAAVSLGIFFDISISLLYLNSSLNPILYCWKIREVKQAVKDTIRQLNCCC